MKITFYNKIIHNIMININFVACKRYTRNVAVGNSRNSARLLFFGSHPVYTLHNYVHYAMVTKIHFHYILQHCKFSLLNRKKYLFKEEINSTRE